jgi:heme oxygenase-like protein
MSTITPGQPRLPTPRGPLSATVIEALGRQVGRLPFVDGDPFSDDHALALHVCYELHYRGFAGVAAEWEWEPELLRFRRDLERGFMAALRADVAGGDDVPGTLDALLVEPVPGNGVSHFLRDHGEWWQAQEYFVHRSIYHLKEADPHAWVIPRLQGQAKAALVAVEYDEFGGGRGDRMHAQLFADLLVGAGLSASYLSYLDEVTSHMMQLVNLMSMLGLHRSLRGGLVGHFAAAEITTPPSAHRMTQAMQRLDADPACVRFFTEHVEADAVHEQVMRTEVVGDLLEREPELAADVVFGVQATDLLEQRLTDHLLACWQAGRSSLVHGGNG